ncbi:MAG: ABC transporter substrate-binding protein [Lachnospiraceae bacterium]|nr:ABC transporter substrate-binding protein [Lachnospiraceae bacterium]
MMKKLLSLAMAATLAFSVVACGGTDNTQNNDNAAPEASEDAGSTDATTDAATEGDVSSSYNGVLKVGGIGPTTGGAAVYGKAVMNAANLAVEEINAAGGVNGMELQFQFEDDEHDAEKSVNAYNTLKDWGMQMLMGTVTSTPCTAVVNESAKDNMFHLTPSGSAVESIAQPNAFRVCFSDPNQGAASAQYIGENGIATKVAVIYDSSDVYSSGIYEKFAAESANQGIEIVAQGAFTADNKTDFSQQLQAAKDAGAELVFLPIYYTEASVILKQAAGMNYEPIFFGCDGLDGLLAVEGFDTSLAEGVMLLTPFAADAEDEKTKNFVAAYQAAYGEIPNQFAADAYDAMYIIKAAAEQAGITADMSVSDMCEGMKTAMTQITVDGLTGEGITWDAEGEPSKSPKAVKITDGVYTAM